MKTVYAPDTAPAFLDALHGLALANPLGFYGATVALLFIGAAWLAHKI